MPEFVLLWKSVWCGTKRGVVVAITTNHEAALEYTGMIVKHAYLHVMVRERERVVVGGM